MSNKQPITPQGLQKIKDGLKHLLSVERPNIVKDIEEARAHGDLKENAEYHAAKEKQGHIEGKIMYYNGVIATAEVIDPSKVDSSSILFGATVTYEDTETGDESTWQIVGNAEADVDQRKISVESPIAKALLGQKEGDIVLIKIPKGKLEVEITGLEYT